MAEGNITPPPVRYEAREDVTRQDAAARLIYNTATFTSGRRLKISFTFHCIQEKVHSAGPWEKKDGIQVSILSSPHETQGFHAHAATCVAVFNLSCQRVTLCWSWDENLMRVTTLYLLFNGQLSISRELHFVASTLIPRSSGIYNMGSINPKHQYLMTQQSTHFLQKVTFYCQSSMSWQIQTLNTVNEGIMCQAISWLCEFMRWRLSKVTLDPVKLQLLFTLQLLFYYTSEI